jgi:hypothetical protein
MIYGHFAVIEERKNIQLLAMLTFIIGKETIAIFAFLFDNFVHYLIMN